MDNLRLAIEWLRQAADPNDVDDSIGVALADALELWAVDQTLVRPSWLDAALGLRDLKYPS